jgi:serine/threonine protein kinase
LKPDNVLVEFGSGIARLCDFGLAQRAGEETITAEGVIAGTPAYMAPEQAAGGAVDHRSDLFSLGSLMYSMATAREPFGRQDPFVVMNAIRNQKHDPLDLVDPSIPSWYARLVDRLLEKQPTESGSAKSDISQVGCGEGKAMGVEAGMDSGNRNGHGERMVGIQRLPGWNE